MTIKDLINFNLKINQYEIFCNMINYPVTHYIFNNTFYLNTVQKIDADYQLVFGVKFFECNEYVYSKGLCNTYTLTQKLSSITFSEVD